MANTPQAKKRIRRNEKRAEINGARMGYIRDFLKKVEVAIEGGDKDGASALDAQPELARGVARGAPLPLRADEPPQRRQPLVTGSSLTGQLIKALQGRRDHRRPFNLRLCNDTGTKRRNINRGIRGC